MVGTSDGRGNGGRGSGALLAAGVLAGGLLAARALARRARRIELGGKLALVTGGSRGLGLVLARELASRGARVAICARDADELERARRDLEGRGATVAAVACDVTDGTQVRAMVADVERRLGPVDVLVNNAGIIEVGPFEEMTRDDYERAMRVHFWAPLQCIEAVLPGMRARGAGRIVNIASIGGKISVPHLLPYSASKFALVGLSEGLHAELRPHGILVTTVCPGLMRTGSPGHAEFKGKHREEFAWFDLADSLPVVTAGAERAARLIVDACRHGDAELVFPWLAALQVKLYGLLPGIGAETLSLMARALPDPGGIGTARRMGAESASGWAPSPATALTDRAALANNEVGWNG